MGFEARALRAQEGLDDARFVATREVRVHHPLGSDQRPCTIHRGGRIEVGALGVTRDLGALYDGIDERPEGR